MLSSPDFIDLIYRYSKVMTLHLTFSGQGIKATASIGATGKVANQVSGNLVKSPSPPLSPLNGDLQEANEVPWGSEPLFELRKRNNVPS